VFFTNGEPVRSGLPLEARPLGVSYETTRTAPDNRKRSSLPSKAGSHDDPEEPIFRTDAEQGGQAKGRDDARPISHKNRYRIFTTSRLRRLVQHRMRHCVTLGHALPGTNPGTVISQVFDCLLYVTVFQTAAITCIRIICTCRLLENTPCERLQDDLIRDFTMRVFVSLHLSLYVFSSVKLRRGNDGSGLPQEPRPRSGPAPDNIASGRLSLQKQKGRQPAGQFPEVVS
jgi:hypothetical protein